jgi:serine protease Do
LGILLSFYCVSAANAQCSLPDFTVLAEKLMPTVVNITIELDTDSPEYEDEELTAPKISSGSGFIISPNGYIVTNKHVVDNAKTIHITTGSRTYKADIIGIDNETDIALLIPHVKTEWKAVEFGDSDKIKVGEWILAIGNPFGLGNTVTKGIVSAKSRDIESGNYDSFIQTDASINRGNSGGPMFNMQGELIGINNAIFSTTGSSMGIGFAIPINHVKWVVNELKTKRKVERGWVGIGIQSTTFKTPGKVAIGPNNEERDVFFEEHGAIISVLTDNAPAQKSGMEVGDIIIEYNDTRIDDTKNLSRMIAETPIGGKTKFKILRQGKEIVLDVIIEKMPEKTSSAAKPDAAPAVVEVPIYHEISELGITVVENPLGLIIAEIKPNSDAANKGLKKDDLITRIDNKTIFNVSNAKSYVNDAKLDNNRAVQLHILSQDKNYFATIELGRE